jgi:hypothetical protein
MDNPTVTLLNTLLALTVVVPGVAALIGLRARKTPKFKGPFDTHNQPKTFDWVEKQRFDAESTTGKLSVLPEVPTTPSTSKTTVILPRPVVDEMSMLAPAVAEPPAKAVELPTELPHLVAVPETVAVPEKIIAPEPGATPEPPPALAESPAPTIATEPENAIVPPVAEPIKPPPPLAPANDVESGPNSIEQVNLRLAFAREMNDRRNEATALADLGAAHLTAGAHRKAITAFEQALAIYRELHDRQGEADALGNLGLAHEAHGDLFEPIELFEQALLIYRDLGDRRGEANALWISSLSFNKLGNRSAAASSAETALKIFEELGEPTAAAVRAQLTDWRAAT